MVSPLITRDLSGLQQGLSQGFNSLNTALSQALAQRQETQKEQTDETILQTALKEYGDKTLTAAELISVTKGQTPATKKLIFDLYAPTIKAEGVERARQEEKKTIYGDKGDKPALDPLDPNVPQPQIEEEKPVSDVTIDAPDGRSLSRNQIKQLISSPYVSTREEGKAYQTELNEAVNQQNITNRDIKKKNQQVIDKFSEPYQDASLLASNVNRMKRVKRIIKDNPKDFDRPFWATGMQALLTSTGKENISELFKNANQQKVFSELRPFLAPKDIGGSNPSTREVMINYETLVGPLKGLEANEYIADLLLNEAEILQKQGVYVNKFRDDGFTFSQFQRRIEENMKPFREERQQSMENLQLAHQVRSTMKFQVAPEGTVFMYDPKTREKRTVKKEQRKSAEKRGLIFIK